MTGVVPLQRPQRIKLLVLGNLGVVRLITGIVAPMVQGEGCGLLALHSTAITGSRRRD